VRIIISPAKRMYVDTDSLGSTALPLFIREAEEIKNTLQGKTEKELQELWKCNDSITKLNVKRLQSMNLRENLTPAILAFEGIQYQYMAPGVFEGAHYDFIDEHLRILSGFYGLLRPFDGVVPYRLEMQTKLPINDKKDLYAFWGNKLAGQLMKETDCILNLASKEYSRAVTAHLPKGFRLISCIFGEIIHGRIVEKGTLCKMARGQMVRWMAENNITNPSNVKGFDCLGYSYRKEYSTDESFVFVKNL
jgi:cytoplasmic iron level regulating protein YaaA (DUF328/UPF0246 family)